MKMTAARSGDRLVHIDELTRTDPSHRTTSDTSSADAPWTHSTAFPLPLPGSVARRCATDSQLLAMLGHQGAQLATVDPADSVYAGLVWLLVDLHDLGLQPRSLFWLPELGPIGAVIDGDDDTGAVFVSICGPTRWTPWSPLSAAHDAVAQGAVAALRAAGYAVEIARSDSLSEPITLRVIEFSQRPRPRWAVLPVAAEYGAHDWHSVAEVEDIEITLEVEHADTCTVSSSLASLTIAPVQPGTQPDGSPRRYRVTADELLCRCPIDNVLLDADTADVTPAGATHLQSSSKTRHSADALMAWMTSTDTAYSGDPRAELPELTNPQVAQSIRDLLDEPALLAPRLQAVWLDPGHFAPGDQITWAGTTFWITTTYNITEVPGDGTHGDAEPSIAERTDEHGRRLIAVDEQGGLFYTVDNGAQPAAAWVSLDRCRHSDGCLPCTADRAAAQRRERTEQREYWAQWSTAAHERFEQIEIRWTGPDKLGCGHDRGAGTFTGHSAVPGWLREFTAGRLLSPEAPTLCLARVWDPLDWLKAIDEHSDDLRLELTYATKPAQGLPGISRGDLEQAWQMLVEAGHQPSLDLYLEVDVDATLIAEVMGLFVDSGNASGTSGAGGRSNRVSAAVIDAVSARLGMRPTTGDPAAANEPGTADQDSVAVGWDWAAL